MKNNPLFTKDFIEFFKELAANNSKDWFDKNRKRYEISVKNPFKDFISQLINTLGITVEVKNCIFRINRDIRFSKDKTPYKIYCGAVIAKNGKKARSGGMYIECGPEFFKFYSGAYQLDRENLQRIRTLIMKKEKKFNTLISNSDFVSTFGNIYGEKNKIIPKKFKPILISQPLIMNKTFYFFKKMPAETILKENLLATVLRLHKIASPLNKFFEQA